MTLIQHPTVRSTFTILVDERKLHFDRLPLRFEASGLSDLFACRNNKTLGEMLAYQRYEGLATTIHRQYAAALDEPLGSFLLARKRAGDPIYRCFLHAYGDQVYCRFCTPSTALASRKGLYCFCLAGQIVYVGRCCDSYARRINQKYGVVQPTDCYLGGPVTKCRLNSLMAAAGDALACYVVPMEEARVMAYWERRLIGLLRPVWNVGEQARR